MVSSCACCHRIAPGGGDGRIFPFIYIQKVQFVCQDKDLWAEREIEENNTMGKTRDLFKKIRYQGNILCEYEHN